MKDAADFEEVSAYLKTNQREWRMYKPTKPFKTWSQIHGSMINILNPHWYKICAVNEYLLEYLPHSKEYVIKVKKRLDIPGIDEPTHLWVKAARQLRKLAFIDWNNEENSRIYEFCKYEGQQKVIYE